MPVHIIVIRTIIWSGMISPKGSENILIAYLNMVRERKRHTPRTDSKMAYSVIGFLTRSREKIRLPMPAQTSHTLSRIPEINSYPPNRDNPSLISTVCAAIAAAPDANTAHFRRFISQKCKEIAGEINPAFPCIRPFS